MSGLIERARSQGTPLVEGDTATFMWSGAVPARIIGEFNDWSETRALALEAVGPGVWAGQIALPRDAYLEYRLLAPDGQAGLDPLNPRSVDSGVGHRNNWFRMPEAAPFRLRRPAHAPRGRLARHRVRGDHLLAGGERDVWLYHPPAEERVPLLVVLDGQDYLRRARLVELVEALIARGRIRPIALALLPHGGAARFLEYNSSDATLALILRHILPLARAELPLVDDAVPGGRAILGASLGGLMALYTGLRAPDLFGTVLCQSGGFALELAGHEQLIHRLIRDHRGTKPRVWMDCGRYEWLLESNRETHALLAGCGFDATYREYNGGHNYTAWREDVWRGLEHCFAPLAIG
ncbi:MAG TPA: alpha/beta hydrolase-fold protein [Ktedonobacterales bacterium]|nr:alpha/beta hydrolase-fold protein [Ktedonobacterales bacterium]